MLKGKCVLRTTPLTGKPVFYFAAALGLSVLAPMTAQAQAASDIYKKMSDLYANAKSYQGTISRTESGKMKDGKAASQTITVKINFKAPNKYNVNNKRSVTVNGKTESSSQLLITDGKSMFVVLPEKKMYQRGVVQNENMLSRFFAQMNPANGFTLLPETNINGRAAFAIKPNLPANAKPEVVAQAKSINITLFIDKKTYEFLKMTITSPNGHLIQTVSGQALNGNVPESVFVWTPPAGYKEAKQPTGAPTAPTIPGKAPGQ